MSSLIESGSARLPDAPACAEAALRQALAAGVTVLPAGRLARLSSLIVTAIGSQPGRDADLAAAALVAAEHWQGLSPADVAHYSALAARIYYRLGRYAEAIPLYRAAFAHNVLPYPVPERAVLHEQLGYCLQRIDHHDCAAAEFRAGANLVADCPEMRELYVDLLTAAAIARAGAGAATSLRRLISGVVRRRNR